MSDKINENTSPGLKRTLGLPSSVSLVIGTIIGSGIFISPKSVLSATNSVGLCLVVWALCGVISSIGALCFCELGSVLPESGGEFQYIYKSLSLINKSLGKIIGFLAYWSVAMVLKPTALATASLAMSTYLLTPIIGKCGPLILIKLGAVAMILIAGIVNSYSTTLTQKIIVLLTSTKVVSLLVVVTGGFARLILGYTNNFENSFDGTTNNFLAIATGFYGGLWAYEGWNNLNYVTGEIINPKKNLPLSIIISMCSVTFLYVFTNVSYFTVMSRSQLLASDAVAITWADTALGSKLNWLLPLAVVLSTCGSCFANVFSTSRINFVAGCDGFQLKILAMVNKNRGTPDPSIYLECIMALMYLIPSTISGLIRIFSVVRWTLYLLAAISLIILRFKYKYPPHTFKVPFVLHALFLVIALYLVVIPVIDKPSFEYLLCFGILALGLFFYIPFGFFKLKLPFFDNFTWFIENLLELTMPDKQS